MSYHVIRKLETSQIQVVWTCKRRRDGTPVGGRERLCNGARDIYDKAIKDMTKAGSAEVAIMTRCLWKRLSDLATCLVMPKDKEDRMMRHNRSLPNSGLYVVLQYSDSVNLNNTFKPHIRHSLRSRAK